MKRAIIFGTADFAQVAYAYLRDDSEYQVEAFTINELNMTDTTLFGLPIVPFERLTGTHPASEYAMFCAIGYSKVNANRRAVYETCKAAGYDIPTYIHSSVQRWPDTSIGDGCFIFENNVIQPFVGIGENCILWSGNHVGHHSRIGNNVFIASHVVISGRCTIGDNVFLGVNATLRDGITVAPNSVVGAGSILLKDTIESGIYKTQHTVPQERRSDELRHF